MAQTVEYGRMGALLTYVVEMAETNTQYDYPNYTMTPDRLKSRPQPLTRCASCYNLLSKTDTEVHTHRLHILIIVTRQLAVALIPDKLESCPLCSLAFFRADVFSCSYSYLFHEQN
jgi:hypothetical protein